jgi:hypothetical protein
MRNETHEKVKRQGLQHRTAPITAMGPRRGKSHENQPPSQSLGSTHPKFVQGCG